MQLGRGVLTYSYNGEYKYAILKDGTIVIPNMWSLTELIYNPERDGSREVVGYVEKNPSLQEIFFSYRFIDRLRLGRKTAFAHMKDIIAFSNSKKTLRIHFKNVTIKNRREHC